MPQLETFLDNYFIEEIPVEDAKSFGLTGLDGQEIVRTDKTARRPQYGKILSAAPQFARHGLMIDNPLKVGDVVKTSEFGRNYITFSVEDEKPGATKYYTIRFDDIEGKLSRRETIRLTGQVRYDDKPEDYQDLVRQI